MNEFRQMVYFKWMCLPRWLRTSLIAAGLTLITAVVFIAIILGALWFLQNINPLFILIIPLTLVVLWVWYAIIEDDIKPSIKRKEKID